MKVRRDILPTLSERFRSLPPSKMRRIFDLTLNHQDVLSLGLGEPDFTTPRLILDAGVSALRGGETGYSDLAGRLPLREAVARHLERLYGVSYEPRSEILITVGSTEAMFVALLALLDPGDEVLVPTPSFLSYVPTVKLLGGVPREIAARHEEGFRISAAALEAAVTPRTKAVLLNFPNNPTGAVLDRRTASEIAAVTERHGLFLISDEIYDRFVYGGQHLCLPTVDGLRSRTMLLGGFSKTYAMTGWRLGFAAGPAEWIEAMLALHQYVVMCAPTVAQRAAIEAIEAGEDEVGRMLAGYDRRRRRLLAGLRGLGFDCTEPDGAYYVFPKIGATGLDDVDFAERLVAEERVLVVPGSIFGAAGAGHVRCSYAASSETLEEALVRIERFMNRMGHADDRPRQDLVGA